MHLLQIVFEESEPSTAVIFAAQFAMGRRDGCCPCAEDKRAKIKSNPGKIMSLEMIIKFDPHH